jgi:glycosyltransferase involved in cell wall biosynthesis
MEARPSVCVITTVHPPQDSRIFTKECESLAKRFDVTLLCFSDAPSERRGGVRIKTMPKPKNRLQRVLAGRRMLAAARAENADIYHFHDPEFLLFARRLQVRTGRPVIYDVHEDYPQAFAQKTYLPGPLKKIAVWAVDLLERTVAPALAAIVVADEGLERRFGKMLETAPRALLPRLVLVKNYPPLTPQSQLDMDGGGADFARKPWAVHVGVFSEIRGAWTLLDAFAQVHDRMPEAQLVLVGDVRVDEHELATFLERRGVDRSVDLRGFMPYPEAMALVQRCRVGISPLPRNERYRTMLSSKVFDYMGCATPYVASDFGELGATVGETGGRLVDTEDAAALAEAILEFVSDEAHAREVGSRGREAAEREFNWSTMERRLMDLYDGLLAQGTA